jgi:hypothetical protein
MLIGIDLGTSSLKVTSCDDSGRLIDFVSRRTPISYLEYSKDIIAPIRQSLAKALPNGEGASACGVAAVAPALTCVHRTGRAHLLTSHIMPVRRTTNRDDYVSDDIAKRLSERRARTEARLSDANLQQCLPDECDIVPLATLLGLIVCGRECHDPISWYELGYIRSNQILRELD